MSLPGSTWRCLLPCSLPSSVLCSLLFLASTSLLLTSASEVERSLIDSLFEAEGYNEQIRPIKNINDVTNVDIVVTVFQILNVTWHDSELTWNVEDYSGINRTTVLPQKVWQPEIVLINNADGKFKVSFEPNVILWNDGKVEWLPPSIYKSACTIDMTFFPFDSQSCEMKFASWTYNADEVRINSCAVDWNSTYKESNSWDLMDVLSNISLEYDSGIERNFSTLIVTFKLKRKPLYYTVNLILPCVLISAFSTWVFYLPANFLTKKITMCVCILLALVFFLTLVYRLTPQTSLSIPLLTKYLLFTFIMHIVAITGCVLVLNWNFRTPRTHVMPRWVRLVFLNYLPRLLLMARPTPEEQQQERTHHQRLDRQSKNGQVCPQHRMEYETFAGTSASFTNFSQQQVAEYGAGNAAASSAQGSGASPLCCQHCGGAVLRPSGYTMHTAVDAISFIASHLKTEEDFDEVLDDWHFISLVLDRLHFAIFMIVTVGGLFGFIVIHMWE